MPEILYSSIFGALTQHVQARFDAASKLHKQLFDNVIFERFLDWDTPTIGLDFEEIIDLWIRYYDRMSEEDKALLPIIPVYFLKA